MHDRGHDPDGVRRHTEALLNAEDLTPRLGQISTPTAILHGADDVSHRQRRRRDPAHT